MSAGTIPGLTQGFITRYPTALPPTVGATVVFTSGVNMETSAVVALGASGNFDVIAGFSDIGLVVDLTGYFTELSQHLWGAGSRNVTLRNDRRRERSLQQWWGHVRTTDPGGLPGHAAQACPKGTWVCTAAELGIAACDTAAPAYHLRLRRL